MTRRKRKKILAFPSHWAASLSSQAPCFVLSSSCQWRCVQKQNRGLAVLTIHSCWAETSATAPLISVRLCLLCFCKLFSRGFLSQSIHNCPSVTWAHLGALPGLRSLLKRCTGVKVRALSSWGSQRHPALLKWGAERKGRSLWEDWTWLPSPSMDLGLQGPVWLPLSLTLPADSSPTTALSKNPINNSFPWAGMAVRGSAASAWAGPAAATFSSSPASAHLRGSHCSIKGIPSPSRC